MPVSAAFPDYITGYIAANPADALLGGAGSLPLQRANLALLKSTANAATNNNPEFLGVYSPSATVVYTTSPDATLSQVLKYTDNQDKMRLLGGTPVQNTGVNGVGITVDNWAVQQSNRGPATGILTTANGWGANNSWDMWAGAVHFILAGTQKCELLLRQIGGESGTSKVPIRTMVRPVDASGNPTGPFQYLDKTGIGIFANNSYYHIDNTGSAGPFEYRVEHRHCFQALRVLPGAVVTIPAAPIKMTWDGDSFGESQTIRFGGAVLGVDHFAMSGICSRQLGFFDANPIAVGLTGYVVDAAAARRNLLQRVTDWTARQPQIHLVMASYNDGEGAAALAAIDVNMTSYVRAVRAALPATYIVVAGCPDNVSDTKVTVEAQCLATFTAWNDRCSSYIPAYPVAFERDSDGIHPTGGDTGTGHKTWGDYLAAQILTKLNALKL